MSKKVLVLCGSPRKKGNTDNLAEAFIRGAKEAGNEARKLYIRDMDIKGCLGCSACQKNGGVCIQKDDMGEIYTLMLDSDVIVLASPVYFYTWTSQMKAVVDRTFAIEGRLENRSFYLISAGAAPSEDYFETMKKSFEQYISCFRKGGNAIGGYVFGISANGPKDVIGTEAEEKAYQLGRSI